MTYGRKRGWIDFDDLRVQYKPAPPKPAPGSFGPCLNDPGNPPIFWTLETVIGDMGVFRQSDDPANIVQFPIADFWPLI